MRDPCQGLYRIGSMEEDEARRRLCGIVQSSMKGEKHIHLFGRIVFGDGLPSYGEFSRQLLLYSFLLT
jgi:hypothetical protein